MTEVVTGRPGSPAEPDEPAGEAARRDVDAPTVGDGPGRGSGKRGGNGGNGRGNGGNGKGNGKGNGGKARKPDGPGHRLVHAPLTPPWSNQGLFEVFRRRYILTLLVRREIAARYQGSVLGLVWSYVNPLTQFFIYYFVMGILFGRAKHTQAFAIHVFAALIIVHFFIETMNAGTRSIVRNKQLVQKMAVPREMFPVASMLVSLFHVVPQVMILLVATYISGWRPDPWGMALGVIGLLTSMALGTALALVFSAANVFLRDVSNAVNVLANFIRFGVPMMYPYALVALRFRGHTSLYLANPITEAVLDFQRAFWVGATSNPAKTAAYDMPPNLTYLSLRALLISVIALVVAQSIFSKLERRIPERLL